MKKMTKILCLVLVLGILLSGCSFQDLIQNVYDKMYKGMTTSYEDMSYTRPDMDAIQSKLEECLSEAKTATKASALMDTVYEFYQLYYDFSTNYQLANLHYCKDLTDDEWETEYNFCMDNSSQVDAAMDQLLYALADSPLREELEDDAYFGEGFFDDYQGDSIWDETFTALSNKESTLLGEYYSLSNSCDYSDEYFDDEGLKMEEIYRQLIAVRQEMATYAGYDSYADYAYDSTYSRDYAPKDTMAYLTEIQQQLAPLYGQITYKEMMPLYMECTESEMYAYTQSCAEAIGGVAKSAFALMESAKLYDITYSEDKYDASFEVYLYNYNAPYVFVNPTQMASDQLTFTHEFGHFCSDYAAGGSNTSVDVAEIFSQGLEYLSLCYCENTERLTVGKMADSLQTFVVQAAYADFEHRVYDLTGEDLTVENIRALYRSVMDDYGLTYDGWDCREYTLISHYFIAPMYVISYVISNDAAMQIYQVELAETGAGVTIWEDSLATDQSGFLAFIEEAKLENPFAEGRVQEIRETFETVLG